MADSAAEMGAVVPAAGASEAAMRFRLDRRVGAEAAWGFSKGKAFLSVVRQARGRKLNFHLRVVKVTIA
jgi:hypothetical protein